MDLNLERRNTLEYLKEFNKSIPKKRALLSRKTTVDNSKLSDVQDKIERFYEVGALVSPMKIDKDSIEKYLEDVDLVKQFTSNLKPDNIMEKLILEQTKNARKTRTILLPNIVENNSNIQDNYDKMVAYYMLMDGNNPIERFSNTEMQMKKYGVSPDIGSSIMKYGDELTTKLEELAVNNSRNTKEWEQFKKQVIHSYEVAEKIGNRNVNKEEHKEWEERLIKLGILERKLEKQDEQKIKFNESLKVNTDKDKDESKSKVLLENALLEKARQDYIRTGMVPIGFKKNEEGQIVRMEVPKIEFEDERKNRLSASRDNLSATNNKKQEQEQLSR